VTDEERFAALRLCLDSGDAHALDALVTRDGLLATDVMTTWPDHPMGVTALSYVAMMRYDTVNGRWRNVENTGLMAQVLIASGAPVNGDPSDRETPLITAASYGDSDVAAVLIAAGADLDALARNDAGGVPGGSALLHAAVFGMTDVIDLLAAAGARIRSLEEAAAAGDLSSWSVQEADEETRLRALVMAAHHERIDVINALINHGTPIDGEDAVFRRHPLRLAASSGRAASVRALLAQGVDPTQRDREGLTALGHCRRGRITAADPMGFDEVERLLAPHVEG
jgi:uncharacterized protein